MNRGFTTGNTSLGKLVFIFLVLNLSSFAYAQCDDTQACTDSSSIKIPVFKNISKTTIELKQVGGEGGALVIYKTIDDPRINITSLVRCGCSKGEQDRIVINPTKVFIENRALLGLYAAIWKKGEHIAAVIDDKVFNKDISENIDNGKISTINFNEQNDPGFKSLRGKGIDVSIISGDSFTKYMDAQNDAKFLLPPPFVIPIETATNPIERLEYIKLIALLFDKTDQVEEIFEDVNEKYETIKKIANTTALAKPSVFFNYPTAKPNFDDDDEFQDKFQWQQPGPKSILAHILEDARGAHRFAESDENGKSFQVSYADILTKYRSAKFLLNAGNPNKITADRNLRDFVTEKVDDNISGEENFGDIIATKITATWCENVYGDQKKSNSEISDIDEGGIARPDLILKDFVSILHPEVDLDPKQLTYLYKYNYTSIEDVGNQRCKLNTLREPKPKQQNKEETIFVDQEFVTKNEVDADFRFRVEDKNFKGELTDEIKTELRFQLDIENVDLNDDFNVDLEIIFPADLRKALDSLFIVRAEIPKSLEQDYKRVVQSSVIFALASVGIPETVEATARASPTPSASPSVTPKPSPTSPPDNVESGGGISGGGIAGIVIAVIIILAIILFFLAKRRGRTSAPPGGSAPPGEDWIDDGAGLGGAAPAPSQRRRLFGGRRQQRIGDGAADAPQSDDPFDI